MPTSNQAIHLIQTKSSLFDSTNLSRKLTQDHYSLTQNWYLVGSAHTSSDLFPLISNRLPLFSNLKTLAIDVSGGIPERLLLDSLSHLCRARKIQLRIDTVLSPEFVSQPNLSPLDLINTYTESISFLDRDIQPMLVLPATPETIRSIYPFWFQSVQRDIKYQVSVGGIDRADEGDRYLILEFLENLAHHPSVSETQQGSYDKLRSAITANAEHAFHQTVEFVGEDSGMDDPHVLFNEGHVAVVPSNLTRQERIARLIRRFKLDKWYSLFRGGLSMALSHLDGTRTVNNTEIDPPHPDHILVIGWYGTETAGDKAILGGLLHEPVRINPHVRVTIASSMPFYTEHTLLELGHANRSQVIPYDYKLIKDGMNKFDVVCIGGGPLMDLVEMYDLIRVFHCARRNKIRTVIAGCGVGPVKWMITRWAITTLAALSDEIILRDGDSLRQLEEWGCAQEKAVAGKDPAISYVSCLGSIPGKQFGKPPILGMAVREWTRKFRGSLSVEEFDSKKTELMEIWLKLCDLFIEDTGGEVRLIPMHTLHIGDDDRWYQEAIRSRVKHQDKVISYTSSYSAADVAAVISECDLLLCMRYHSFLFSTTLGIPNIYVDYTQGGKLTAFSEEIGYTERGYNITSMDENALFHGIQELIADWINIRMELAALREEWISDSRIASRVLAGVYR